MVVDDDPEGSPIALTPRWKGGSKKKGLVVEEEEVEVEVSIEDLGTLTPGPDRLFSLFVYQFADRTIWIV